MAWLGLDKLFLGTSLDEQQQLSDSLDSKITAANQQLENQGFVPSGYTQAASNDIATADVQSGAANVVGSVDSEFAAGAKEGLQNVLNAPGKIVGGVGSGLSSVVWGIVKNVPWWIYAGGAVALFIWLGGLELLRGRLAKR